MRFFVILTLRSLDGTIGTIVMTLAALLPVVGHCQADAIGVGEVGCPIVRGVYGIAFCIGCCYASPAKLSGYGCDICRCIDTQNQQNK